MVVPNEAPTSTNYSPLEAMVSVHDLAPEDVLTEDHGEELEAITSACGVLYAWNPEPPAIVLRGSPDAVLTALDAVEKTVKRWENEINYSRSGNVNPPISNGQAQSDLSVAAAAKPFTLADFRPSAGGKATEGDMVDPLISRVPDADSQPVSTAPTRLTTFKTAREAPTPQAQQTQARRSFFSVEALEQRAAESAQRYHNFAERRVAEREEILIAHQMRIKQEIAEEKAAKLEAVGTDTPNGRVSASPGLTVVADGRSSKATTTTTIKTTATGEATVSVTTQPLPNGVSPPINGTSITPLTAANSPATKRMSVDAASMKRIKKDLPEWWIVLTTELADSLRERWTQEIDVKYDEQQSSFVVSGPTPNMVNHLLKDIHAEYEFALQELKELDSLAAGAEKEAADKELSAYVVQAATARRISTNNLMDNDTIPRTITKTRSTSLPIPPTPSPGRQSHQAAPQRPTSPPNPTANALINREPLTQEDTIRIMRVPAFIAGVPFSFMPLLDMELRRICRQDNIAFNWVQQERWLFEARSGDGMRSGQHNEDCAKALDSATLRVEEYLYKLKTDPWHELKFLELNHLHQNQNNNSRSSTPTGPWMNLLTDPSSGDVDGRAPPSLPWIYQHQQQRQQMQYALHQGQQQRSATLEGAAERHMRFVA
ncbi:uncharacterized protein EV422DRAFT_572225 [Fimicolochytrium jonesii]|uniref:uncharacterized protein n=1 Tax=Fimicolochytrium jonesii TaxID=1396493 RepID=UPI0022FEB066|nr:uncharacterized protein EV422DRAFT_572225 [Fimicolochytrium jonesii]KAI8816008.1 hypothetical protein EV422DRAFT_572225 [Fimicolochytrium jonesii]